jgi:DAACS family dicarboxylate/amino acid:cation (Na+ or H+) symporter
MLLALAAGVVLGLVARAALPADTLTWIVETFAQPIGQVFLRLLFMLVLPLLFSALVMGVAEVGVGHLGRLGGRMLGYTVLVSAISVVIGVGLVNALGPGRGLPDEVREAAATSVVSAPRPPETSAVDFLVAMVPDNVIKAAANGDMLAVIVFSLLFGIALAVTRTDAVATVRTAIQGLYDITMTLIEGVLRWVAPIGVGALLFSLTARLGAAVFQPFLAYVGVVLLGLGIHQFGVYSLSVRFFGGMSPLAFFRGVRLAMLTAFSTASSSATLPTAIKVADENLRLPPHVARFVLTAGSAMNQNGTALFEGVTVLFLAQVYGVELDLVLQVVIVAICILGGVGTAGVPAGSLPVIAMILGMFGIPPEGLALILGVDRLLDMCRTTVNVTGDLAAAVYVARGERAPAPAIGSPGTKTGDPASQARPSRSA